MRRLALTPTLLAVGATLAAGCSAAGEPPDPGTGGPPTADRERGADEPSPGQRKRATAALLVRPRVVAPGESLEVTVDNRSRREILYGLAYTIERRYGTIWQTTGIAPRVFPQIGLVAPPRRHGKPQRVQIPTEVEPGRYRVVKRVAGLPALRGEFRVR